MTNWDTIKYFKKEEFDCKHTGDNKMHQSFMELLDKLRAACGFPFVITSGYRSPEHPIEAKKANGGGQHTKGNAADIAVNGGNQRLVIVQEALKLGFTGIGVAKGFIHVDTRETTPVLWLY